MTRLYPFGIFNLNFNQRVERPGTVEGTGAPPSGPTFRLSFAPEAIAASLDEEVDGTRLKIELVSSASGGAGEGAGLDAGVGAGVGASAGVGAGVGAGVALPPVDFGSG